METLFNKYCSKEWVEFIDFNKSESTYGSNQIILKENDPTLGLYFIKEGKAKIIANENNDRIRLIRLAADGDIIGHRGFGGDWTYPISVISLTPTTVIFVPIRIFDVIAKTNPEFTYQMMMFFAEELRCSEEKVMHIPVKNRIARAILMNYKAFGLDKEIPGKLAFTLSRKDLASKASTTYETTIRVITDLKNEKVIDTMNKEIKLLDIDKLQVIASEFK